MPIVKCECKECKFYDDKFYCCKDVVELTTYGQCVEGIKIELNQALEEQKATIAYYNYNTYFGGGNI